MRYRDHNTAKPHHTTQPKTPHSQKHHRLDASCGFYRPDASCQQVVSGPWSADFIKLHQVCEYQTCCNVTFADLLQVDETTCVKPACSLQLAASLLTTCNRLFIIKPEQAMRTHSDIGLVIADLLQLARFWLCTQHNTTQQNNKTVTNNQH